MLARSWSTNNCCLRDIARLWKNETVKYFVELFLLRLLIVSEVNMGLVNWDQSLCMSRARSALALRRAGVPHCSTMCNRLFW